MVDNVLHLCEVRSRLEKLERENRRIKTIGCLVALIAISLFVMGQAKSDRTLEAQKFVLRDASGRVGGELAMDRFGATLTLRDRNGRPVMALIGSDSPSLSLIRGEESFSVAFPENGVTLVYTEKILIGTTESGLACLSLMTFPP